MLALIAVLALQYPAESEEAFRDRVRALPPVVQEAVERRANCNHWSGEEAYDADRRQQIDEAIAELGCKTISAEIIFLRRYFANRADILEALNQAEQLLGF